MLLKHLSSVVTIVQGGAFADARMTMKPRPGDVAAGQAAERDHASGAKNQIGSSGIRRFALCSSFG
jgi:hypothetical protein